ncbi:MAG: hypothetical protein IPM45_03575 [Acidimicrobiales bacterium]|nr:hypothetical protein [Acidimicrobiales bacterium]
MTPLMQSMVNMEEELLDLLDRVEEPIVSVVGTVAEAVADYIPERPAWPFLSELPTLTQLVDNGSSFAHKLVTHETEYAKALVKAMHPVLVKIEAKPARKRAPRKPAAAPAGVPKAA